MIYFDNAATGGRKPDTVLTAVQSAVRVCANPGRSGHKLSLSCARLVQETRNALNDYFQGSGFERVIFTKNCTEALNLALFGVLKKGDHVVVSCLEHNSVLRPLEFLRKNGIITYDVCPLDGNPVGGEANISLRSIAALLRPNTRMVVLTTASNVTGAIPPFAAVRSVLPKDVLLLCDGAQGCGHLPVKMQSMGIDLLSIAGHKGMMGIQGSGALLFSERVDPTPMLLGGTGSMSTSLEMPDFYPDALEAGTLSFPAMISLLEGARYLFLHEQPIREKLLALSKKLIDGLRGISDCYTVYSKPNACGIVAFSHRNIQSEYVADILSAQYDIAVRGGLHCAPLAHEALGTLDSGLVRVSFSAFNNEREVDRLLTALSEMRK